MILKVSYKIFFDVNNIFDENYAQAYQYSVGGREFNFGLKESIQILDKGYDILIGIRRPRMDPKFRIFMSLILCSKKMPSFII